MAVRISVGSFSTFLEQHSHTPLPRSARCPATRAQRTLRLARAAGASLEGGGQRLEPVPGPETLATSGRLLLVAASFPRVAA
eukprot:3383982-Rhodomonas_salina.3